MAKETLRSERSGIYWCFLEASWVWVKTKLVPGERGGGILPCAFLEMIESGRDKAWENSACKQRGQNPCIAWKEWFTMIEIKVRWIVIKPSRHYYFSRFTDERVKARKLWWFLPFRVTWPEYLDSDPDSGVELYCISLPVSSGNSDRSGH